MFFVSTAENLADPICELVSAEQSIGLDHTFLLPCIHLGSMGLSPGLFLLGQKAGHHYARTPRPLLLTSRL